MSEKPFKPEDVIWPWTPTGEEDWCRNLVADEYAVTEREFFWRTGTVWNCRDIIGPWVCISQLLRELTEAKQRIEALESLCVEATNELTKTLPANHPLRIKLDRAGDGKEIGT